MKRSSFLKIPLITIPLSLKAKGQQKDRPKKGFKVGAGEDRFKKSSSVLGNSGGCKVSGKDTAGDLLIFEEGNSGKGGPPLHVHYKQDEWFYVLEGEYLVKVGDETFRCKPGDSVFAPRKVPHTYARIGDGLHKKLTIFQPAGKFEDFHDEVEKITVRPIPIEVFKKIFRSHDMDVVGPRLTLE